jgi:hypothetical protein
MKSENSIVNCKLIWRSFIGDMFLGLLECRSIEKSSRHLDKVESPMLIIAFSNFPSMACTTHIHTPSSPHTAGSLHPYSVFVHRTDAAMSMYSITPLISIVLDSHNEALGCSAAALNPET